MKKLSLLVVFLCGLALSMGLCQNRAHAVPVEFDIVDLYDWGRSYSYADPDGGGPLPGVYTPTNVNPFDLSLNTPITENTFGNANGTEDTFGIAQIDQIENVPGTVSYFDKDTAAYELTIFFSGFDDDLLSSPDVLGKTSIASKGGSVQIYQDFAQDYTAVAGTAGRTAALSYTGATEGLLVLDLVPVLNATGHTLSSTFDFGSQEGSGIVFLETTGLGAWDYFYDTNTQLFGSDFRFSFTAQDNTLPPPIGDWTIRGDGRAEANVVPEPKTVALLGIGLVGMMGVAVRKRKLSERAIER